jgi:hypothetical protein
MRLGVPFIAPRQLGAIESNPGKQILPSIDWCTGHCPVQISFLFWRSRPLTIWSRWRTGHCLVHTGQSGAPIRPLAWPRVTRGLRGRPLARPTVGSADRWLTRQSGAPPDSLVIYSRTPPFNFRERLFHQRQLGASDTVRCTQTEQSLGCLSQVFSICLFSNSST